MTRRSTDNFSAIGGHRALDFVNTRPMRPTGPSEKLSTFKDLLAWARFAGLISARDAKKFAESQSDKIVSDISSLREALRKCLIRQSEGDADWTLLIRKLNTILRRHPGMQKLTDDGEDITIEFQPRVEKPADLIGLIALEIADFIASGDYEWAHACEGDNCVLWFVDRTRNHSRHWCRMETCGARAKARAYYQRNKKKR